MKETEDRRRHTTETRAGMISLGLEDDPVEEPGRLRGRRERGDEEAAIATLTQHPNFLYFILFILFLSIT